MTKFKFKHDPYPHQLATLGKMWNKEEYALWWQMGSGKTKAIIDNIAILYEQGLIEGAIIIAPKGVYRNWSDNEIPTHMPDRIDVDTVVWTPSKTRKQQMAMMKLYQPDDRLKIFVINVEAFSSARGAKAAMDFAMSRTCLGCVDESSTIKTPTAKRTKAVIKLRDRLRYRRVLSGSPVTKSPLDLYGQCAFLGEHCLGFSSYYAFRNRYAVLRRQNFGGRTVDLVVGHQNVDELSEKLKSFSSRILKEDVLKDLPEKIYHMREVEMTPEQSRAYKQMKEDAFALINEGESMVSATIALTQLQKLHQVCMGFIRDDDGVDHALPHNRVKALMETLEEVDGKVIIWANHRFSIHEIEEALIKAYGKESVCTYYGDTPDEERSENITRFQDPEDPLRFFISNRTGAYGITLTQAETVIYYSNVFDLEVRLQSEDRAHRPDRTREDHEKLKSINYIDLFIDHTVDVKIIKALRNKINIAGEVLGEDLVDWLI